MKQVLSSTVSRHIGRLLADLEIPAPKGHARRRRGQLHRFFPASFAGAVAARLRAELGVVPDYGVAQHVAPHLAFRSPRPVDGWMLLLWLPDGGDFCVLSA